MSAIDTASTQYAQASTMLANLYTTIPLMRGSLVASVDGRVLVADLDESRQGATAAVVASSFALGAKLAEVIGNSGVGEMTVQTDDGYVCLYAAGDRAVLATLAMPNANLGLLNIRSREAAASLAELVPALVQGTSP